MAYNDRIRKKRLGKLLDSILETGYFVNCNYHPVKLTEWTWGGNDLYSADVSGVALTNDGRCICSLAHCAPDPITETVALEMASVYKERGDRGLAIKYGGYTEEQYTEFEKMWR